MVAENILIYSEYVKQCHGCALVTVTNIPEPLKMRSFPTTPWNDIAIDFCGPMPNNIYLLVIINYYSRFQEVIAIKNHLEGYNRTTSEVLFSPRTTQDYNS